MCQANSSNVPSHFQGTVQITTINFAIRAINGIIGNVCNSLQHSLASTSTFCTEQISSQFEYEDPFASLQTEYQQTKFYREQFGLIVSHYR